MAVKQAASLRTATLAACRRGLSPRSCLGCHEQVTAVTKSKAACEIGQQCLGSTKLFIPPLTQKISQTDYLRTDWNAYLTQRGFLTPEQIHKSQTAAKISEGATFVSAIEHILSSALTYPLSIAHAIASIVEVEGLENARQRLVKNVSASHNSKQKIRQTRSDEQVEITIIGARAEANVQLWAWQELAFACKNILGTSDLVVNCCGPALHAPSSSAASDEENQCVGQSPGHTEQHKLLKPLFPNAAQPVMRDGVSVTLQHFTGVYQDIASYAIQGDNGSVLPSLSKSTTMYCLFNPGIAHPNWYDLWTPALEALKDTHDPRSDQDEEHTLALAKTNTDSTRPKPALILTSFDYDDNERDNARAIDLFGPPIQSSETPPVKAARYKQQTTHGQRSENATDLCDQHLDNNVATKDLYSAAPLNPFRGLKFHESFEKSPNECGGKSATLLSKYVQTNWSLRVYLPV